MAFLQKHRSRILNRVPVSRNRVEQGSIIEFRYKSIKTGQSKPYMAIVLEVWPPAGSVKEKKVHAFSLATISDNEMKRFIRRIGAPAVDTSEPVSGKQNENVSKFNLPTGRGKAEVFYETKLSKNPKLVRESYRTFNMDRMTNVSMIEYDFKNIVPKGFGI
jgi:hypothetical protein